MKKEISRRLTSENWRELIDRTLSTHIWFAEAVSFLRVHNIESKIQIRKGKVYLYCWHCRISEVWNLDGERTK